MLRLLTTRSISLCTVNNLSSNTKSKNSIFLSGKACQLCNTSKTFSYGFRRYQSTHPSLSKFTKIRRRMKKPRSYSDVVCVTSTSAMQTRTNIENLDPSDVSNLALSNYDLSELYKLKQNSVRQLNINEYTYNSLADINNFPTELIELHNNISIDEKESILKTLTMKLSTVQEPKIKQINFLDNNGRNEIDELVSNSLHNVFKPEGLEDTSLEAVTTVSDSKKVVKLNNAEQTSLNIKARSEVMEKTFSAYIDICNTLHSPQKGLRAFLFMKHLKCPASKNAMKSIRIYNGLLKGFGAKGDFFKLSEVLRYMTEDKVLLNLQSYIYILECLARGNNNSHLKHIKNFAEEAFRKGFTFECMLRNGIFSTEQHTLVLRAMKLYDYNFIPHIEPPNVQFKNHLVNSLNHEDQLKGFPETSNIDNGGIFEREQVKNLIKKQFEIEKRLLVSVKNIVNDDVKPSSEVLQFRKAWTNNTKLWEEATTKAFNRDLASLSAQRSSFNLVPYLRSIPVQDFVTIIIDEVTKIAAGSETYSPTVGMLYMNLGTKVYSRYKVLLKEKTGVLNKIISVHEQYCDNYVNSHDKLDVLPSSDKTDNLNGRQKWQWVEYSLRKEGASIALDHNEWVPTVVQSVGKFLYNIIMHDILIDVNVMRLNAKTKHKNYLPAFYTIFRNQGRVLKEEVKPHPVLAKLYKSSMQENLTFPAYELPMRCPPVPWTSVTNGGYLIAPCDLVRLSNVAFTQRQRLAECDPSDLYPSYDALNQLGSIPWKVNRKILDVIIHVFKNGGSAELDVPQPPSALGNAPSFSEGLDKSQKYAIFRQKLQLKRKKAEMYSLWCDCLYRLCLANHFKDDTFWLPHNMDFRGRVYPIPPHLNHLGSDLARSMLVFAEARPLGPKGLDWLKIHLINLTGTKKKESIDDRLKYANDILDLVIDSADDPLNGKKWWSTSDEPWQTLACCMEIADASRSADPTKYMSHFPVHQDGSCNGLQHYAALGRDKIGAYNVNLTHATLPQDVYMAVATLVEEKRVQDAKDGIEIAKVLEGFVKRKVIKQTVMTTVYGVTRFGARLQIAKQLKDIESFPKDHVWAASSYLTRRTFDSLGSMFTSTREIQDWFSECAKLIASVSNQNVEWVTPLGFPIAQPYFRYKKPSSNMNCELFLMDKYEKPNVMKQKNAFPPNFVHSLDSSHMMLTSLFCERAGITFVSVHDCYWTHPSTVHIMNKICREQFVALHSEPILENLSAFMYEKYRFETDDIMNDVTPSAAGKKKLNALVRSLPKTGDFDIKEVINSIYFFS